MSPLPRFKQFFAKNGYNGKYEKESETHQGYQSTEHGGGWSRLFLYVVKATICHVFRNTWKITCQIKSFFVRLSCTNLNLSFNIYEDTQEINGLFCFVLGCFFFNFILSFWNEFNIFFTEYKLLDEKMKTPLCFIVFYNYYEEKNLLSVQQSI